MATRQDITSKACFKCGEIKPLDQFRKEARRPDGRTTQCAECIRRTVRAYAHSPGFKALRDAENRERQRRDASKYLAPLADCRFTPTTKIVDANGFDWTWAFVIYRPVEGSLKLLAGSDGTLWSSIQWRTRPPGWYPKKTCVRRNTGHLTISLALSGKRRTWMVHRLVAIAFLGPQPVGKECCHNNGDPTDNNIRNLRWGTRKENVEDKKRHGTYTWGESHPAAKLKESQVLEVRRLAREGVRQAEIARRLSVNQERVSAIILRKTWHLLP